MKQIEYQVRCGQSLFSEFDTQWEAKKEIKRLIRFFGYRRSELTIEEKEVS